MHGNGRARHLHERQDAFLHARAARGGKEDERGLLLHRAQQAGDHRLARRHAERAGHEAEVLRRGDDCLAVQRALTDENGVVELGRRLGVAQPIGVAAPVAELERVQGDGRHRDLLVLAGIEEVAQARIGAHAHVVVGARHHELVGLEVLVEDHLAGLGAFHPQIVRHLALRRQEAADLRTDNVVDPIHALWPLKSRAGILGGVHLVPVPGHAACRLQSSISNRTELLIWAFSRVAAIPAGGGRGGPVHLGGSQGSRQRLHQV